MLLSKECLDGDSDTVPMLRSGGSFTSTRPTSSYGRPTTGSTGFDPAGGADDGQEAATPTSAVNMREKMLQQRQKLLAKKSGGRASGSMVVANKSQPETPTSPARPSTSSGPGAPGSTRAMSLPFAQPDNDVTTPSIASYRTADSFISERGCSTSLIIPEGQKDFDDEESPASKAVVGPQRDPAELLKELNDRGICPVFDPTAGGGGGGNLQDNVVQFDVASVSPCDMRSFLHNPFPKHTGMMQCRITRDRSRFNKLYPKFTMESDSGVFLMVAQKQKQNKTSNYAISMSKTQATKESEGFLGKLRSDFYGLEFTAYGPGLNHSKVDAKLPHAQAILQVREELAAVTYSSSLWGGAKPRGPRKMTTAIPRVQPNGERTVCRTLRPETEGLIAMQKADNMSHLVDTYTNKAPKWNDQIGAYVLNFNKRVTEASVKNFQLVNSEDPDTVYLQFGRVGKEVFNIDFRYPMSPFQAFAICLSSFDYKLCCE